MYARAAQAQHKAHRDLRQTWWEALRLVGLLTAKVVDGEAFILFARSDAADLDFRTVLRVAAAPCVVAAAEQQAKAETAVVAVMEEGLVGQTGRQLRAAFAELGMLKGRFGAAGLGEPDDADNLLEGSWIRLANAYNATRAEVPRLAEDLVVKSRKACEEEEEASETADQQPSAAAAPIDPREGGEEILRRIRRLLKMSPS